MELEDLKKTRFEGKVGRGLVLLESLIEQDQVRMANMDEQISALDGKIQQENQLLGSVLQNKKLKEELAQKMAALDELMPKLAQAKTVWMECQTAASACTSLDTLIKKGAEDLNKYDSLETQENARAVLRGRIEKGRQAIEAGAAQSELLKSQAEESKKALEALGGAEAQKERLFYQKGTAGKVPAGAGCPASKCNRCQ